MRNLIVASAAALLLGLPAAYADTYVSVLSGPTFSPGLNVNGTKNPMDTGFNVGGRIGTTLEVPPLAPIPPTASPSPQDEKRCAAMTGDRKAQCLADLRAEPGTRSNGPTSIGGSSGAGASAATGTTGGGSFGGSAPR